ncbi:S-adenosyl-L-methionine-dependent methyltransferase [Dendrothele bispora CBS 962.96]|uniref:Protein-lysine N-methyltransferase EFM6 n=1 Tax=Dendrothele bispora (strain CBS 962.96) TaxID=1314807 RepID=A0A4S8MR41_DENBC|nr:S-adenosyl-L-methionine-dependent methyltransferase [Dendrothele bispora CBS 962.96]
MNAQHPDGADQDGTDEERLDIIDPLRHLRMVNGQENTGTEDLASSELLAVLPDQKYSIHNKTLQLTYLQEQNNDSSEAISVTLTVDASPGCGGVVWPAGQILSSYLVLKGHAYLKGKNVLELGSGTGLVGLVAAKLGAKSVWITDQKPLLDIMQQNVSINQLNSSCIVAELDWGTAVSASIPRPDIILAADCVYFEPAFPLLVQTLSDLVGDNTDVLFCYKKRRKADRRFFAMLKKKFTWTQVEDDPNRMIYNREAITLIRLSKLS